MERPDVALMAFDLSASGVVRNAIRIAGGAQRAGLRSEIWTVQEGGEMRSDVPSAIPVLSFGMAIGQSYSRRERKAAALASAEALAAMLRDRRPRIAFSAGNHFHELAVSGSKLARQDWDGRLLGRVSNALPRFDWSPPRLPWNIWKRVSARRRLAAMDRLVAVSHALRRDLTRQLLIPATKIEVIPNGIDLDKAARRADEAVEEPWFETGQPPVILGVGRLAPQKDFASLVAAFSQARQSLPMRLLILGEGPQRAELEQLADRLGAASDVRFAGHVANPMPYYRRSGLFVLPSRWEGMSNALLEALAVGCPVLATRCPGSAEVLVDELSGQLLPVGRTDILAERIVAVLRDPPRPALAVERAAAFSLDRTLQAYVDLFRKELRAV